MTSFKTVNNTSAAIIRMKTFSARNCSENINGYYDDNDMSDHLFVSDLKCGLNRLGGELTNDEVNMLVKGIKEDQEEGVEYEDFVSTLIFASFFISTFSRRGSGFITAKDLNKVMMNAKKIDTEERDDYLSIDDFDRQRKSRNDKPKFNGIDIDPTKILDYQNLIDIIENTRLDFMTP